MQIDPSALGWILRSARPLLYIGEFESLRVFNASMFYQAQSRNCTFLFT